MKCAACGKEISPEAFEKFGTSNDGFKFCDVECESDFFRMGTYADPEWEPQPADSDEFIPHEE